MTKQCEICGTALKDDLFSFVTMEPVCSICKIKYIGGLPTTRARIDVARSRLQLNPGQYLVQDNGREASRILGREA